MLFSSVKFIGFASCIIFQFKIFLVTGLKCEDLLMGQFYCKEPTIDTETQVRYDLFNKSIFNRNVLGNII